MKRQRRFASLLLHVTCATLFHAQAQLKVRAPDAAPSGTMLLDVVAPSHPASTSDLVLVDNRKQVPAASIQFLNGAASATRTRQLLFVIDALNSSLAEVTHAEDALETYLTANSALPQPTSILIVSDIAPQAGISPSNSTTALHGRQLFVHRIPPSTASPALLLALRDYRPGLTRILESQSGPGQAERVRLSLEALSFVANAQTPVLGAKVVVWISPGWPYLQSSSAKSNDQLFDSIVYFSNLLRSARILLDAVSPSGLTIQQFPQTSFEGPRDRSNPANISAPSVNTQSGDTFYQSFLKAPRNAAQSNPNHLALQVLAIQSGGLVLQHNNDLTSLLTRCATEAVSMVTLAFTFPPGNGSDHYHELTIKSPAPNHPLRTCSGFYAR